jgi:AcrR family transcriptional regulator
MLFKIKRERSALDRAPHGSTVTERYASAQMALESAPAGRKRGRKPKDPQVILDALERLLAERPFHALSVEDILVASDCSRATFYAHFSTKVAVATALFDQVLDEIASSMSAFVQREDDMPTLVALRKGIDDSTEVWFRHKALLQTFVQNAHAVPEFAEPVARIKSLSTDAIAAEIERERQVGLAPPGHDAHELSAALVECTLQLLHSSSLDNLPAPPVINQLIMAMWCGTVYHVAPPEPG